MDLNKIFEWLRQPVIDEQETEDIQSQSITEETKQTQPQEETKQQAQQIQQQQVQNQQEQKQMNADLPGVEYLTNADLHDITIGRQKFIAKYANFENLNSLLQTIEPLAEYYI